MTVLHAAAPEDDVREAMKSGMDAHIAKPAQLDNLKTTIQQVFDGRAEQNDSGQ